MLTSIAPRFWAGFVAFGLVACTDPNPDPEPPPAPDAALSKGHRIDSPRRRRGKRQRVGDRRPDQHTSADRQTRTLGGRTGDPVRLSLPGDVVGMMVGFKLTTVPGNYRLRVRWLDGERAEVVHALPAVKPHQAWRDVYIELTAGGDVEVSLEPEHPPGAGLLSQPAVIRSGAGRAPRNFILISLDTVRRDFSSAYGYARYATSKHLEQLASAGTRFAQAFAPSPWTIPSHAAALTGVHPVALGMDVHINDVPILDPEVETLADRFSAAGYLTLGFTGRATMSAGNGFANGFFNYQEADTPQKTLQRDMQVGISNVKRWLSTHPERPPTFLFFHTFDAHSPYAYNEFVAQGSEGLDRERQAYASGIAYVDRGVDALLAELRAAGMLEDSIVAVMSDHGEAFEEHGNRFHGKTLHDEELKVPLVFWGHGVAANRVVTEQVGLAHLFATAVELFELGDADGSLAPALRGQAIEARDVHLCCVSKHKRFVGLRTPHYKYIRHLPDETRDPPRDYLFDLIKDPGEKRNVAGKAPEALAPIKARATEHYERLRPRVVRDTPERDPRYIEELRALGYVE